MTVPSTRLSWRGVPRRLACEWSRFMDARAANSTTAKPTGLRYARSRRASPIPVVVNGDIATTADAEAALAASGADAVMVGRGAQGRPWFPGQVAHYLTTRQRLPRSVARHAVADYLCELYDDILHHYGAAHRRAARAQALSLGPRSRRRYRCGFCGAVEGMAQPRSDRGSSASRRCDTSPTRSHRSAGRPRHERCRDHGPNSSVGAAEAVLNSLPHPVIVIGPDGKIAEANAAAEAFFEVSVPLLRRNALRDVVPFGSPLLSLVDQVRARGAAVNEYKVDLSTPRMPGDRLVDLHVAPVHGAARPHRRDAAGAHHRRQDGSAAHPPRCRAFDDRAGRDARA